MRLIFMSKHDMTLKRCVASDTDDNGYYRVTLLKWKEHTDMLKKYREPKMKLNLQFFAEDLTNKDGNGGNQEPPSNSTPPASNNVEVDYDRIQKMLEGTLNAKEDTALKAYFEKQGLSQDEVKQAIATFKEQKAANQPDVNALQQQVTLAQQQAQQALIEKGAYLLSGELGIDLKTMPYLMKLADLSAVVTDGKVDQDKLKEALNKVLEDVPQLKQQAPQATGFRIGAAGGQNTESSVDDQLDRIFGIKKKN